jgi:hypothetical protein
MAATITITYDGTDITDNVLFESASFESQLSAIPGTFEFTVRDAAQELSFITGKEVTLDIDGVRFYGGYLTMVSEQFAFPVDDTITFGSQAVKTRQWVLRGVDYNILFDKRVIRNPSSYKTQIPGFDGDMMDGEAIRTLLCPRYLDLPDDLDYTSEVDDVSDLSEFTTTNSQGLYAWQQQGTVWREVMTQFSALSGAIWYIDGSKVLHWHSIEDTQSDWGFSDVPNRLPVSAGSYLATYGFREMSATEDGSFLINDALIWGGSEVAGEGSVVFAREQNEESIALHNRWQLGETHFGEPGYGIQSGVDKRARLIVEGSASGERDQLYGFKYPQWQFRFAWHDHNLPDVEAGRYPVPGSFFPIILYTFGTDAAHPLIKTLPLRSLRISFPELDPDGGAYVRFDGFFGIQTQDPWTLWKFLLNDEKRVQRLAAASANNGSTSASYGAFGSFYPNESPNGTRTVFTLRFGYIGGTTNVSRSGLFQRPGIDYFESDPDAGEITFVSPPLATDWIWVTCLCLAG